MNAKPVSGRFRRRAVHARIERALKSIPAVVVLIGPHSVGR
jgi:hypothetical protein